MLKMCRPMTASTRVTQKMMALPDRMVDSSWVPASRVWLLARHRRCRSMSTTQAMRVTTGGRGR